MTIAELYGHLSAFAPAALSAEWDNDGIACCTDKTHPVRRVLVALDATEQVVERAVAGNFDLLLTHHPLLFRGVKALTPDRTVPRKLLSLIANGVTAMSFHTRLDAAEGGVNDVLAQTLGLCEVKPFGPEGEEMGRIGKLPAPVSAKEYAKTVCEKLHIPSVLLLIAVNLYDLHFIFPYHAAGDGAANGCLSRFYILGSTHLQSTAFFKAVKPTKDPVRGVFCDSAFFLGVGDAAHELSGISCFALSNGKHTAVKHTAAGNLGQPSTGIADPVPQSAEGTVLGVIIG